MGRLDGQLFIAIVGLTIRKHHGLIVLIQSGSTHVTHQAAVAAVGEGEVVGESIEHWVTHGTLGVLLRGSR